MFPAINLHVFGWGMFQPCLGSRGYPPGRWCHRARERLGPQGGSHRERTCMRFVVRLEKMMSFLLSDEVAFAAQQK